MLTAEGCRGRRQRLFDRLPNKPDAIVICDPRHLVYFAAYDPSPFVFRSYGASAALVLFPDGRATLIADSNVRMFAGQAFVDETVLPTWYDGKKSAPDRKPFIMDHLADYLLQTGCTLLGCESSIMPVSLVQQVSQARSGLQWMNVSADIHRMKRNKDADEIALLAKSGSAGEAGFASARKKIMPGMTELDAYLVIQNACMETAGEQAIVYGDFVTGERTSGGGGPPSQRIIQQGDLILLDFSVVLKQYRLDFAATFACQAKATDRQRTIAAACVRALEVGEQFLKPGVPCKDIDKAVRASIASDGLAEFFKSHVGHGLGLGHPDPPYITPESEDTLEIGDVVTLEPGAFLPGEFGIRVERNYVITESGAKSLTRHSLSIDGVA